jgi:hypothetical protein
MSPSEYSSHPLRELMERLNSLVHSAELTDPDLLSSEMVAASLQSVSTILGLARVQMERTPAQLVSGYGLAQLQNGFQTVFNELSAFQSNKNLGHLQNAKAQVEQAVMPYLWAFASIGEESGLAPLSETISQLSIAASASIKKIVEQRDANLEQTAALARQLQDASLRLEALTEAVAQQKADAATTVAVLQKQYAEQESERANIFESMLKKFSGDFEEMHIAATEAQVNLLASLQASQDQAAQIVQVVGNIGVTGNFQKIANTESGQANLWRWITVAFFGFGIAIAIATFYKFWDQPFTPENAWSVLIRLMYAIAIAAPAWYTARESARHRTNADRARQTELELASLGPFIELMPDDKKHQIREELTKRYFGNHVNEHTIEQPVNLKDMRDFALELVKAVKK